MNRSYCPLRDVLRDQKEVVPKNNKPVHLAQHSFAGKLSNKDLLLTYVLDIYMCNMI